MKSLDEIDQNFKIETNLNKTDIKFYSILNAPCKFYGLIYENNKFRRMPEKIAEGVSEGVKYLHTNTAGGRVRFKTDSSYIAISAKMSNIGKMDHFALTGSCGFDMYIKINGTEKFVTTFRPPFDITDSYESVFNFNTNEMREITINFPLYSDVNMLYIGIEQNAKILEPSNYAYEKPIVYYGSSITQGGCASRPGNAYTSMLARKFNMDHINLGFSGNARGEQEIADYIASLDMEIFVYDYDHNAPTVEHLQSTHEKMLNTIRKANPTLPIILMTSVSMDHIHDNRPKRRDIIYQTYQNAKNNGDNNIYFWDGTKEFAPYEDYGTVEGCHPNDCGFYGMATTLEPIVKYILTNKGA
ncbi:MAG: SGNH/GDSL hydrolase family protein [Clostridia bacterium]|nr:SGNH/GDSL hydrolase family protein [Clostridia bacterium]